jgi:hypothetical protein
LALALFGIGGPAVAGDMYNTPLRPSLVPNNGFTVGLIGGYDLGRVKVAVDPDALSSSLNGFDGGVLFGYDFENDGYFTAFELAGILGGPTKTYTVDPYTLTLGINGHVDARIRAGYRVAGGFGERHRRRERKQRFRQAQRWQ